MKLSSRLLLTRGRVNWRLARIILIVAALQLFTVVVASWLNHSMTLGGGKGLLQHYGAWAILLTDPLLLIASGFLDRQFCVAMLTLPLRPGVGAKRRLQHLLRSWVLVVRAKGASAFLYVLFVVVGLYAWTSKRLAHCRS